VKLFRQRTPVEDFEHQLQRDVRGLRAEAARASKEYETTAGLLASRARKLTIVGAIFGGIASATAAGGASHWITLGAALSATSVSTAAAISKPHQHAANLRGYGEAWRGQQTKAEQLERKMKIARVDNANETAKGKALEAIQTSLEQLEAERDMLRRRIASSESQVDVVT